LDKIGSSAAERDALIAEFRTAIAAFDEDYLAEMQGIADGAGLPVDAIVVINARTEIVAKAKLLARKKVSAQLADKMADGCTGAIILPERTASGGVIQGQNW